MEIKIENIQYTSKDGAQSGVVFKIEYSNESPRCIIESEENKQVIKLDKIKIGIEKYSIVLGQYLLDLLSYQSDLQIKKITLIIEESAINNLSQLFSILDISWQTSICEKFNLQKIMHNSQQNPELLATFLIGAQGDAMGYKYQFQQLEYMLMQLQNKIQAIPQSTVSDDTQLSIYTFISLQHSKKLGLLENLDQINQEYMIKIMFNWLKDWFISQNPQYFGQIQISHEKENKLSTLSDQLCSQRTPGNVTLSSISNGIPGTIQSRINTYHGNGAISRVGPMAFIGNVQQDDNILLAAINAALTHGSDEAIISCAFEISLIRHLNQNKDDLIREYKPLSWKEYIVKCIKHAEKTILRNKLLGVIYQYSNLPNYIQDLAQTDLKEQQAQTNIYKSMQFSQDGSQYKKSLLYTQMHKKYGTGWNADSCLAIALYALIHSNSNFNQGMSIAINNDGPSDSLGCVFGHLWGSFMGFKGVSLDFLNVDLIEEILLVMYGSDFVLQL